MRASLWPFAGLLFVVGCHETVVLEPPPATGWSSALVAFEDRGARTLFASDVHDGTFTPPLPAVRLDPALAMTAVGFGCDLATMGLEPGWLAPTDTTHPLFVPPRAAVGWRATKGDWAAGAALPALDATLAHLEWRSRCELAPYVDRDDKLPLRRGSIEMPDFAIVLDDGTALSGVRQPEDGEIHVFLTEDITLLADTVTSTRVVAAAQLGPDRFVLVDRKGTLFFTGRTDAASPAAWTRRDLPRDPPLPAEILVRMAAWEEGGALEIVTAAENGEIARLHDGRWTILAEASPERMATPFFAILRSASRGVLIAGLGDDVLRVDASGTIGRLGPTSETCRYASIVEHEATGDLLLGTCAAVRRIAPDGTESLITLDIADGQITGRNELPIHSIIPTALGFIAIASAGYSTYDFGGDECTPPNPRLGTFFTTVALARGDDIVAFGTSLGCNGLCTTILRRTSDAPIPSCMRAP